MRFKHWVSSTSKCKYMEVKLRGRSYKRSDLSLRSLKEFIIKILKSMGMESR